MRMTNPTASATVNFHIDDATSITIDHTPHLDHDHEYTLITIGGYPVTLNLFLRGDAKNRLIEALSPFNVEDNEPAFNCTADKPCSVYDIDWSQIQEWYGKNLPGFIPNGAEGRVTWEYPGN